MSPDQVALVVVALATLHNFGLDNRDLMEDPLLNDNNDPPVECGILSSTGRIVNSHYM